MLLRNVSLMILLNFTTGLFHPGVRHDYGLQGNLNLFHSLPDNFLWLRESGGGNSFNWSLGLLNWVQLRAATMRKEDENVLLSLLAYCHDEQRLHENVVGKKNGNYGYNLKTVLLLLLSFFDFYPKAFWVQCWTTICCSGQTHWF